LSTITSWSLPDVSSSASDYVTLTL
jgi:hypothetical protein